MEFEAGSEKVDWEAQRVAVAFGVQDFRFGGYFRAEGVSGEFASYRGQLEDYVVTCSIVRNTGEVCQLAVGQPERQVFFLRRRAEEPAPGKIILTEWRRMFTSLGFDPLQGERTARGVYRLGIEEEQVWRELNIHFSAHEKMELRLSMPREFWPQKWLDEEQEGK